MEKFIFRPNIFTHELMHFQQNYRDTIAQNAVLSKVIRDVITIALTALLNFGLSAQSKVMDFEDAPTQGIDIQSLDEVYPPAIGPGEQVIYKNKNEEFIKTYSGMLQQLSRHLNKNGFYWKNAVRCFNLYGFSLVGPHQRVFNTVNP